MLVPELFIEFIGDRAAVGLAYIPVQELGSKSRSDSNSDGDTGDYKAEAEVDPAESVAEQQVMFESIKLDDSGKFLDRFGDQVPW